MVPVGCITLILKSRESYRDYMALFDNCTNGSSWLHNFDPKKQIIWPSSIIVQMVPVGCITLIIKSRESYRDYMALFDNCTNGSCWLHNFDPKKQGIIQGLYGPL